MPHPRPTLAAALLALLPACTTTATGPGAADDQLRAQVDGPLRRAGVSEACIASLDTTTLTQVRSLTLRSPRNSTEVLQQRQQLRTFVARSCPDL